MNKSLPPIPLENLGLAFLPVLLVVAVLYRWSMGGRTTLYAVARMLVQLLLIGYVLTSIFQAEHASTVMAVLAVMLFVSSWIALRPLKDKRRRLYPKVLTAIGLAGIPILLLVTQVVLNLQPWYEPRYLIPLAGMIFATAMNSLSLAAERFTAEIEDGVPYETARRIALRAALIPITNSLFAVGLVSFPGMMTGQILSGVSPLVAARYQIVVMCMIFGAAGVSSTCFLMLMKQGVPDLVANEPT